MPDKPLSAPPDAAGVPRYQIIYESGIDAATTPPLKPMVCAIWPANFGGWVRFEALTAAHQRIAELEQKYRWSDEIAKTNLHNYERQVCIENDLRAELTAAQEARQQAEQVIHALLANPYGCSLCDSGKTRNVAKGHQPTCSYVKARAFVGETLSEDLV